MTDCIDPVFFSDHSSIRAEGSVSSKSLFSETGSVSHGQPQPSALASKRPRFNVSIYGSPVMVSDNVFERLHVLLVQQHHDFGSGSNKH